MSAATPEVKAAESALGEERVGTVRIDGARHGLIWAYTAERTVSVLLDRPDQGGEKVVRLIGAFWPEEDFEAVEALAADYEEKYVRRPRAMRIRPRPVEAADLTPRAGRP
ncbi:MAG: hypothetical protein JSS68_09290 [Actinobacteria bacterium]|nr:hypothetical protein [Actinomycetota bacterium]